MITNYEHMLISALRYALGRRTYIVSTTAEYIANEIPKLSEQCKNVMIQDIEVQERLGGCGDQCDKESWMWLLGELKGEEQK